MLVAAVGAHCIVLPLLGIAPRPWDIGTAGLISELVGTALWIWTIECVRRAMLRPAH
ncbi:DUF1440 domain-containing protein [Bordetella petrii]|nr:DUF1440 domain-containing protein [Bordetella petrii]